MQITPVAVDSAHDWFDLLVTVKICTQVLVWCSEYIMFVHALTMEQVNTQHSCRETLMHCLLFISAFKSKITLLHRWCIKQVVR